MSALDMAADLRTSDDNQLSAGEAENQLNVSENKPLKRLPCIHDLPEEILILIFGMTSPYRDFKSIMLVCQNWNSIMTEVIYYHSKTFYNSVAAGSLIWQCHDQSKGNNTPPVRRSSEHHNIVATVTERYSHSSCCYDTSMYVFGGCASTSTTFNDLWRFDLGLREWIRPLVTGSYPSPKACATLTAYKDCLILFGGWSHNSLHIFHQSSKFFNQLHVFHPSNNKWTLIDASMNGPEGKAGHGATIIEDSMIVFGGYQGLGTSCNDIWVLDLLTMNWTLKEIIGAKPSPRYSHAQVAIDDRHILVLGGCGGPNMQLNDAWLLTISLKDRWKWDELVVLNPDQSASQLMCHQACLVKDKLVVLSKNSKISPPVYLKNCTNPCRLSYHEDKYKYHSPARLDQSGGTSAEPTEDSTVTNYELQLDRVECNQLDLSAAAVGSGAQAKRCCPDSSDSDEEDACMRTLYTASPRGGAMLCSLTLRNTDTRIPEQEQPLKVMREEESMLSSEFSASSSGANHLRRDSNKLFESSNLQTNASASDDEFVCASFDPDNDLNSIHQSSVQTGELRRQLPSDDSNIAVDGGRLSHLPAGSRSQFPSIPTSRPVLSPSGLSSGSRPGLPSIRPNAMKNRQRQLDTLRQYEEKFRARKAATQAGSKEQQAGGLVRTENVSQNRGNVAGNETPNALCATSAVNSPSTKSCGCDGSADYHKFHRSPLHPMFVHTLDVSEAVTSLSVAWLPISAGGSGVQGGDPPPEETIFYSLVEGRGELIVFGGIQGDMASMQRAVSQTKNVTNTVYYLTAPPC